MATLLYGRDKKTKYELEKQLRSGGEGIVYTIAGKPYSVAKIYKQERIADPQLREATKNKILAMLDMHFDPRYNGRVIIAWPEDALFDSAGSFQGFVMPKIENMKSLIWATRPSDRAILWPNGYHWRYSVAIAFNLALTVEHIHKAGIVVGDMNTNNILINSKGDVTLIDADSFNVTTRTGQEYKCIVGFPEVLPAELQGKDLTKPTSKFTEQTDCFALAVHIFNLLCNNCHPFGCLNFNTVHGSSSNPQIMANIVKGYCPYVTGSTDKTVDDALDMEVFPKEIRALFDRAFHYNAVTAVKQATIDMRPSALEWRMALSNLYNAGVNTCNKNPLHEFPKSYHNGCPWCAIEQRKQMPQTNNTSQPSFIQIQQPTRQYTPQQYTPQQYTPQQYTPQQYTPQQYTPQPSSYTQQSYNTGGYSNSSSTRRYSSTHNKREWIWYIGIIMLIIGIICTIVWVYCSATGITGTGRDIWINKPAVSSSIMFGGLLLKILGIMLIKYSKE